MTWTAAASSSTTSSLVWLRRGTPAPQRLAKVTGRDPRLSHWRSASRVIIQPRTGPRNRGGRAQHCRGSRDRAQEANPAAALEKGDRIVSINGAFLWLPPSVAAIGTFSSSQRRTQVWFAPAGFNRGGLTEGSAGIPVIDVAHQLRRKDRDDLYSANINPIAKFPAEGVVIFGQKTLQVTPSALDRINVRRLMIFVKKRISQIASGLLFDPNVQQTWKRFTAQVNPFLADVKTNFGLSDYRVVLDETTTTPDLVDRNILYAQIYLKPTRAIEFIAIDFNITRTGASFDD